MRSGCGQILKRDHGFDVLRPGHPCLTQLPLGIEDTQWMPIVAQLSLIVVTRDLRLTRRPSERAIWREYGLRVVLFGGREDMRPRDEVGVFLKHLDRIDRFAVKEGHGPWGLSITRTSARPIDLLRT